MKKKAVFPGQYIQGQEVINEVPGLIDLFGSKGLIIGSKSVKEKILPEFASKEIFRKIPFELFGGECCEDELNRLALIIKRNNINVYETAIPFGPKGNPKRIAIIVNADPKIPQRSHRSDLPRET